MSTVHAQGAASAIAYLQNVDTFFLHSIANSDIRTEGVLGIHLLPLARSGLDSGGSERRATCR